MRRNCLLRKIIEGLNSFLVAISWSWATTRISSLHLVKNWRLVWLNALMIFILILMNIILNWTIAYCIAKHSVHSRTSIWLVICRMRCVILDENQRWSLYINIHSFFFYWDAFGWYSFLRRLLSIYFDCYKATIFLLVINIYSTGIRGL